jgi:ABC-type antimicrobial peptide transport system permease subunit
MARLAKEYPRSNLGKTLLSTPVQTFLNQSSSRMLWILQAATLVLLLVGVVNVTSLLLVRGVVRRQEIAMRAALGASRSRLVQVVLFEGLTVGLLAALVGASIAFLARDAVFDFAHAALPSYARATLDLRVLSFAAVVAVVAGLAAAAGPAWRMRSVSMTAS